jgi:hypothetical protein
VKRSLSIACILIVAAFAKAPLEHSICADRIGAGIKLTQITPQIRSAIPQTMAIALLGGFRGVVADFVWIQAHGAWERQEWYKMPQYFRVVTTLQPKSTLYWQTAAWHMAWNISYAVSQSPTIGKPATREYARRQWIEEGRAFLLEGIKNVPDRYDLYFHLGWLIMQKQDYMDRDPTTGFPGKHFMEAAPWFDFSWEKFPKEAPIYVSRMAGHCYMKAERWQEARDWWCELLKEDPDRTKHPDQMWHKIEEWGRECEDKLNLPAEKRCFPAKT